MDKLNHYRDLIKRILTQYHQFAAQTPSAGLESLLAFDETRDQYLWFQTGWRQKKRVRGITVHIQIKNDKIWIEEDWTEVGIANELLNLGVPSGDIVLGFHPPDVRQFTEFALA
ncbi:XisI protein [Coleofasciculus chthonoplastes]|jgi:hypothetical protein|uniref:XisI protein n=1 Tax=Coleofasciculus chthonoplastes TaxID=64178 RepID=UPI0032F265FF